MSMQIEMPALKSALDYVQRRWPDVRPFAAVILGSGWGASVSAFKVKDAIPYSEIPGLGAATVIGHSGQLVRAEIEGRDALIFQGRRHWYEGAGWTPVAIPPFVAKYLGATYLLLTNAAGGIHYPPGTVMVIEDHIHLIGAHPLHGPHHPELGVRFPDLTAVYDPELRKLFQDVAADCGIPLKSGLYLAASGPTYETPAEIRAYRFLGAHAVGMSTTGEAILGHAMGLRIAGLSCIANYAAGLGETKLNAEEVITATQQTMPVMKELLSAFLRKLPTTLA